MGGGWRDCQWINNISLLKEEGWPLRCTGLREKERGEINKVWLARSLPPRGCGRKKDPDSCGGRDAGTSLAGRVRSSGALIGWRARVLSARGRRSNLFSIFCAPRLRLRRARRWEGDPRCFVLLSWRAGEGETGRGEREEEIVKWSDNSGQPYGSLEAIPPLRLQHSSPCPPPRPQLSPYGSTEQFHLFAQSLRATRLAPWVWGLFKALRQPWLPKECHRFFKP